MSKLLKANWVRGVIVGMLATIVVELPAIAQGLPAMYKQDSVRDLFHDSVATVDAPEIVLQRPKLERNKIDKKRDQAVAATESPAIDPNMSPKEQLIAKYGDPLEREEVKAKPDAPRPYQAMLEAISMGDEQLAFQYARKYVLYMRDLQETLEHAVNLQGVAMVREGEISDDAWIMQDEYRDYHKYIKSDLKADGESESLAVDEIEQESRAVLKEAVATHFSTFTKEEREDEQQAVDQDAERQRARRELAGELPVDPQGKVAVMFFIRPTDYQARQLAPVMEALSKQAKKEEKLQVSVFSIGPLKQNQAVLFHRKTGSKFPILNGKVLAQKLKIEKSPTVMLVALTTTKSHLLTGPQSEPFLMEAIRIMTGRAS